MMSQEQIAESITFKFSRESQHDDNSHLDPGAIFWTSSAWMEDRFTIVSATQVAQQNIEESQKEQAVLKERLAVLEAAGVRGR